MLTPQQIAESAEHLNGARNIAAINKAFRDQDESRKWPVSGNFNATERAIRRTRALRSDGASGLEYALTLNAEISRIVNAAV
jgi:hypothetical protein